MCGRGAVQLAGHATVDLRALAARLRSVAEVSVSGEHLSAIIGVPARPGEAATRFELTVFADGRAIVGGTADPAVARSVYARFVGS